ncbi:MAG: hypothetical protein R3A50_09295 [Saprospiraceae bacterium]
MKRNTQTTGLFHLLFGLIAICALANACKKTDGPDGINDPVFWVSYEDTVSTTITAGQNNVYHYTSFEEIGSLFHSISTFSDVHCPSGDCPTSVQFEFYSNQSDNNPFIKGFYTYLPPDTTLSQPTSYTTRFGWFDIFQNFNQLTFMIEGDTMEYTTPIESVELDLPNEVIQVTVSGSGSNNLSGYTHRSFHPGAPNDYPGVVIHAIPDSTGLITLNAVEDFTGSSVDIYKWNTGDTTNSIFLDTIIPNQSYTVLVQDDQGHTAEAGITLPFQIDNDIITTQAVMEVIKANFASLDGTVTIQYTDAAGIIWRSDKGQQLPGFSYFEVTKSEDYGPNERGDFTRKLSVNFQAMVYNSNGFGRPFTGQTVVAIARP